MWMLNFNNGVTHKLDNNLGIALKQATNLCPLDTYSIHLENVPDSSHLKFVIESKFFLRPVGELVYE